MKAALSVIITEILHVVCRDFEMIAFGATVENKCVILHSVVVLLRALCNCTKILVKAHGKMGVKYQRHPESEEAILLRMA